MDPISCFALAGTVLQFVDFTSKLISVGHELYKAGELSMHEKAALATNDLLDLSIRLQRPVRSESEATVLNQDEAALQELCSVCQELAEELIRRLNKLKVNDKRSLGNNLRIAFRSVWARKDLDDLEARLVNLRSAIDTQIIVSLRQNLDTVSLQQSQYFALLDHQTQQISKALSDLQEAQSADIKAQLLSLCQLLSHGRVIILSDKEEHARSVMAQKHLSDGSDMMLLEAFSVFKDPLEQEQARRRSVSVELLQDLRFQAISDRYEGIAEAHKNTFEWIYKDAPFEETSWSNFSDWLRYGKGMYWIQGKAGSGKSTLMKFLSGNQVTHDYLKVWAEDFPLYTAQSYLWNTGTQLQKSQSGLLRTLLYDILRQAPDLLPVVFPRHWATKYWSRTAKGLLGSLASDSWSLSELTTALETLLNQGTMAMRVCIFVDGLDEYEGLDSDIAKLFSKAAATVNVKVCASSRPHLVFQDRFGNGPGLRLQDLTAPDIQRYITDRLVEDPQMQGLMIREPVESPKLITEIMSLASGVFLWVELVVYSLLTGLGNHDQISDLQRRLRLLPRDLEQLYYRIVLKLDDNYREETSRLLQLIGAALDQTDHRTSPHGDMHEDPELSIFTLALTQDTVGYAADTSQHCHPWTVERITDCCKVMDDGLKSRCGGLVETQIYGKNIISHSTKVAYHHRTIRDFLIKVESRKLLANQIADTGFSPNFLLHRAYMRQLILTRRLKIDRLVIIRHVNAALRFACLCDVEGFSSHPLFLPTILNMAKDQWAFVEGGTILFDAEDNSLQLAIICRFHGYLRKVLTDYPRKAKKEGLLALALLPPTTPPLDISLVTRAKISMESERRISMCDDKMFGKMDDPARKEFPSLAVVSTLLKFGANPNEPYGDSTIWTEVLLHHYHAEYRHVPRGDWAGVIKALLEHGADPDLEDVFRSPAWNNIHSVPKFVGAMRLGTREEEIMELFEAKRLAKKQSGWISKMFGKLW